MISEKGKCFLVTCIINCFKSFIAVCESHACVYTNMVFVELVDGTLEFTFSIFCICMAFGITFSAFLLNTRR